MLMAAARAAEHTITSDWTLDAEAAELAHGTPSAANVSDEFRERIARSCVKGVQSAEIFVLRLSEHTSRGSWFEFGIAETWCADRWVIGAPEQIRASVFTTQATRLLHSDEEALALFKHVA